MFGKSLTIAGALAGALMWSVAAQAASSTLTPAERHYNEPFWLYNHVFDLDNLHEGPDHGLRGDHGGGGNGFVGGASDGSVAVGHSGGGGGNGGHAGDAGSHGGGNGGGGHSGSGGGGRR